MQPTSSSNLADPPFRLQIAPGEAIVHPGWQRARAAALEAVNRGGAAVLLGPPGTGKTLLLQDLARTLRHEGWSVRLVERGDALDPGSKADVLLVDEAGRMDAGGLARLCAADTPFVLAALPGFAERLAGLPRPVTPVALEPLPPEGIARFVAARLAATGRPRDMLEPDAVFALARHSAGSLRLVNVLAGTAVFLAELEGASRVRRRHVDEAASTRDGADEDAAPAAPAGPDPRPETAGAAALRNEAPPARPVPLPPRRRRRVALGAAAVGLGLLLAGGWVVSERPTVHPPGAQPQDRGRGAETPPDVAGKQPPGAQSADRGGDAEAPRTGGSDLQQQRGRPPRPEETGASPPPSAGVAPRQRLLPPDAIVSFRGPVYSETLNQGGQMSLVIKRQGPSDSVVVRFEAWGGLLGSGELVGHLSADGRISASGQIMVGRNPFACDLTGVIAGGKLVGSATFVRGGAGRVSRSTFTLTRF